YVALGVLLCRCNPVADRFRDYISMPKYNMYRSLHTAVLVGGEPVGVLIRTPAMDAVATFGVAARIREAGGRDGKGRAERAPRKGRGRALRGGAQDPRGRRPGRQGQRGPGPPGRPRLAGPAAGLAA